MTGAATPALDAVRRAGIAHRVHRYDPPEAHGRARDARPSYGTDAAAALGVEPSRVGKTLAVELDGRMALAVVGADRDLDLKAVAQLAGARRAVMAEPSAAERATGSVVGGISPLGTRRRLPVVVDAALLRHDTVFVSAGRRGVQLELAPGDLVGATGASVGDVARVVRTG